MNFIAQGEERKQKVTSRRVVMQRKVFRIPYMYSTEKRQAENYVIYRKILQTHTIGKSCTYHLCRIIIDYVFNGEQSS